VPADAPAASPCVSHSGGSWTLTKDSVEFFELPPELRLNLRTEKARRLAAVQKEMRFIIDSDDPTTAPGSLSRAMPISSVAVCRAQELLQSVPRADTFFSEFLLACTAPFFPSPLVLPRPSSGHGSADSQRFQTLCNGSTGWRAPR